MAVRNNSVFDLKSQQDDIDSKIVVALEKMSEVFRVLLWDVGKELKLSPIQLQILVFVKHHRPDQCKVGYLAQEFNLTKPTVSDSVRILLKKELLRKIPDEYDARSYSLQLTKAGATLTGKIEGYTQHLALPLSSLSLDKKNTIFSGLIELLHKLQEHQVIEPQRMCFNCAHYVGDKTNSHYCGFLKKELSTNTLRVDCPEFE